MKEELPIIYYGYFMVLSSPLEKNQQLVVDLILQRVSHAKRKRALTLSKRKVALKFKLLPIIQHVHRVVAEESLTFHEITGWHSICYAVATQKDVRSVFQTSAASDQDREESE